MKCAIVLSGLLRGHDKTFPSLKSNILDNYDCNIFCNTWSNQDEFYKIKKDNIYIEENTSYNLSGEQRYKTIEPDISCLSIYNASDSNIVNSDDYFSDSWEKHISDKGIQIDEQKYWIIFNIENILKQWYMVKLASKKLMKNIDDYDYIFRIRYDSMIENLPKLNEKNVSVMNSSDFFTDDTFACGPKIFMKHYLNYYDYLKEYVFGYTEEILSSEWFDGNGAPLKFKAECMMNEYLRINKIDVDAREDIKIKHHIWPDK